jgi:hypothetical protein
MNSVGDLPCASACTSDRRTSSSLPSACSSSCAVRRTGASIPSPSPTPYRCRGFTSGIPTSTSRSRPGPRVGRRSAPASPIRSRDTSPSRRTRSRRSTTCARAAPCSGSARATPRCTWWARSARVLRRCATRCASCARCSTGRPSSTPVRASRRTGESPGCRSTWLREDRARSRSAVRWRTASSRSPASIPTCSPGCAPALAKARPGRVAHLVRYRSGSMAW